MTGSDMDADTPIYWSLHSDHVREEVVASRLPRTTDSLLDPKSRSEVGVLIGFVGVVGVDSASGRPGLVGLVGGMDKVKSLLKPKPNPQQQLRDWQRRLRQESRNIERQIRGDDESVRVFFFFFFLILKDLSRVLLGFEIVFCLGVQIMMCGICVDCVVHETCLIVSRFLFDFVGCVLLGCLMQSFVWFDCSIYDVWNQGSIVQFRECVCIFFYTGGRHQRKGVTFF